MLKVSLNIEEGYLGRFSYMHSCREQLLARGIDFQQNISAPDISIVQDSIILRDLIARPSLVGPSLVYERIDSAALNLGNRARNLLCDKNVKGWLKETAFRDKDMYNGPHAGGRFHLLGLLEAAPDRHYPDIKVAEPAIKLDPMILEKVITWPPVHLQTKIAAAHDLKPKAFAKRRKDISFAGTVEYGSDIIAHHRMQACTELLNIPDANRVIGLGRVFRTEDYYALLTDTKIFVSPYGFGEYSFKDYEAAYAGAIVIRPPCSHVETAMVDIYAKDYCVVETDPWMQNLKQVYEMIMDQSEYYVDRSKKVRKNLIDSHAPDKIADVFDGIVRGALERKIY